MHRAEMIPDERPEFLWCLHCERAYRWGEYRLIGGLQMCPYDGCDGDTVMDGWPWDSVRKGKQGYPKVPRLGHVYELYRTPGNVEDEFQRFQHASKYASGLMPQATAARVLGLSKQRVNELVADGRLRQHDFFRKNFVSCADIAAFKKVERPSGRPRKKRVDESP
jgi:hypothetical protein